MFGPAYYLVTMFIFRPLLLAFVILLPATNATPAQYNKDGNIAFGKAMASKFCAQCHSIEKQGPSPLAVAPPFRELSSRWPLSHLEEALAEGIVTGHDDMPEFELNPTEIINLLSFIDSISHK